MNIKYRRILAMVLVTIAILACGILTACKGNDDSAAQTDNSAVAEEQVASEDSSAQKSDSEEAKSSDEEKVAEEKKEEEQVDSKKDTKEETKKDDKKDSSKKDSSKKDSSKKDSSKSGSDKKPEASKTPKPTKTPEPEVCYVSVDNYCSKKAVTYESGDTPYSVLKKTGAKVSARNTSYGIYVEGINGLYEFDKGDESGWMYKVNGKVIMDSAGDYKLSPGDSVVWYYVTEF